MVVKIDNIWISIIEPENCEYLDMWIECQTEEEVIRATIEILIHNKGKINSYEIYD
jgi:hypothetical protein